MSRFTVYTAGEELANALTHGVGLIVAIVALGYIISVAPFQLSAWQATGVIVYGVTLILMFLTSTLYHAVWHTKAKEWLKRLDHCAIYLLIAGSFTPLLTIPIASFTADVVLVVVWSMAVLGVVFKIFFTGRFDLLSVGTYLVMGWMSLLVSYQLYHALAAPGFALLLAGGLAYTLGVVFYVSKKIPFNHAIWHCFVFAGAISHCWLIVGHVLSNNPAT